MQTRPTLRRALFYYNFECFERLRAQKDVIVDNLIIVARLLELRVFCSLLSEEGIELIGGLELGFVLRNNY